MSPSAPNPKKSRVGAAAPRPRELPPNASGDSFAVVTREHVNLSQALVVIGFPSVGLVGSIATAYLVGSLQLREVGGVLSQSLPPTAIVQRGIGSSPVRVFIGDVVCGPGGNCEQLCVIQSNIRPKPAMLPPLAYAVVSWAREHGARQIVCLEGLRVEEPQAEEARIFGVASDEAGHKMFDMLNVLPQPDGLLVGLGGVLLYVARAVAQPALCLLAETREDFPDARGAARLLEVLQPLIPLVKIDEKPLLEQAKVLEATFRKQLERSKQAEKDLSPPADMMFG
jgi:uncharacterized protein